MKYSLIYESVFEKQIRKIRLKDPVLFDRIFKKLEEACENPEHYKPLKGDLKGHRRIHFDPFVIIFSIDDDKIILHLIKHHDEAY